MCERDVRRDDDYRETRVYFLGCENPACAFATENTWTDPDEAMQSGPEYCPECGGDLVIGSDWV